MSSTSASPLSPGVRATVVLLLLTGLIGSISLIYPFGRDQGVYAFMAYRNLQGDALYRDIFYEKPPLTAPVHVVAQALFGHSMRAIRILDLLWMAATALLIGWIGTRSLRDRSQAIWAAALFVYSYFGLTFWMTAQTDGWLTLPSAAAVFLVVDLLVRERVPPRELGVRIALCGASVCIACLFKYTAGLLLPGLLLIALSLASTRREAIGLTAAMAAGFAAPIGVTFLWLWIGGSLEGFWSSHVRWITVYSQVRGVSGFAEPLALFARSLLFTFPLVTAVGTFGALVKLGGILRAIVVRDRNALAPAAIWIWLLCACVSVVVQGKFFPYHFVPVLAPLALLGVWGVRDAFARISERLPRGVRWAFAVVVIALLAVLPPFPRRFDDLRRVITGEVSESEYWSKTTFDTRDFSFRDDLTLVDYLRRHTKPTDRVNVWGFEPLMNFLAERDVVGRFGSSYPLTLKEELPELRAEYLAEVRDDPPEYFVIQRGDAVPFALGHAKDSWATFHEFPELADHVRANYRPIGAVGHLPVVDGKPQPRFLIYRRNEGAIPNRPPR